MLIRKQARGWLVRHSEQEDILGGGERDRSMTLSSLLSQRPSAELEEDAGEKGLRLFELRRRIGTV